MFEQKKKQKNKLEAPLLVVDFSKAFDSLHRGKMEQILLANRLPRETVTDIMMLYKNTKEKIRSSDGDTDFFDFVVDVLQEDTPEPYLFIICQGYVLRKPIKWIKENGPTLEKVRSRRYPARTITDVDYADDRALQANTPVLAEYLWYSLEREASGIGFHVNSDKTEYMCFY